jgi:hypothetical protein
MEVSGVRRYRDEFGFETIQAQQFLVGGLQ